MAHSKSPADILFQPLQVNKLVLKNRIAMAPMTRSFAPQGIPTDDTVEYYRLRAAGGTGLIFTEATCINHKAAQAEKDTPFLFGEKPLAGWKKVIDAVHTENGKIAAQLFHSGLLRKPDVTPHPEVPKYGPSKLAIPGMEQCRVMTIADIQEIITAYAQAAKNAKTVGFDAVEVHAAHGYLIDQFLWEGTNKRTDQYGGDMENRSRFACEIITAVREAVGPDFPISLRLSQWKLLDFTTKLAGTPEILEALLKPLSDAGVDIFHCSTRRVWEPEFDGSELNFAGWVKKITGKPTISVGSVSLDADAVPLPGTTYYREAEPSGIEGLLDQLEREEFDIIAVGRAMIANPDWANKVRSNLLDDMKGYKKTMLDSLV